MKLTQILLSQSEAGAETYFEKVAAAFAADPDFSQEIIIEEQASVSSDWTVPVSGTARCQWAQSANHFFTTTV